MWMSSEDARSDFILAVAGMALGTMVLNFVVQLLPGYPSGALRAALTGVWITLLTIVVARFFVRHRQQGLPGYGLDVQRSGLTDGALIAAPLAVTGYAKAVLEQAGPVGALLGRAMPLDGGTADPVTLLVTALVVVVAAVAAIAMYGLLTTRARDAFRSPDVALVEALRTYALSAVGISTLLGIAIAAGSPGLTVAGRLVDGVALVLVVLLADRLVDTKDRTTRATVLAPAVAGLIVALLTIGGGLFGPNTLVALWRGTAAGAVAIVVASLIETRRTPWAAVPVAAAAMWSPACTSLVIAPPFGLGGCL